MILWMSLHVYDIITSPFLHVSWNFFLGSFFLLLKSVLSNFLQWQSTSKNCFIFVCLNFQIFSFLIIFSWVSYYCCPNFLPLPPSTQYSSLPQAIHTPFPCPLVMSIRSLVTPFPLLYFTSPWLICNYLFVVLFFLLYILL